MQHEWILDVIADLRSFARQNDLMDLASQMDTAWVMASAEIASLPTSTGEEHHGDAPSPEGHIGIS